MKLFSGKNHPLAPWIERVEEREKVRIYRIKGELNTAAVASLEKFVSLARRKKQRDFKHILLDFEQVNHIDFSIVAALLRILNGCEKIYRKLALMNLKEQPQNMLWLAKVGYLFPSYATEAEAVKDLETRF